MLKLQWFLTDMGSYCLYARMPRAFYSYVLIICTSQFHICLKEWFWQFSLHTHPLCSKCSGSKHRQSHPDTACFAARHSFVHEGTAFWLLWRTFRSGQAKIQQEWEEESVWKLRKTPCVVSDLQTWGTGLVLHKCQDEMESVWQTSWNHSSKWVRSQPKVRDRPTKPSFVGTCWKTSTHWSMLELQNQHSVMPAKCSDLQLL